MAADVERLRQLRLQVKALLAELDALIATEQAAVESRALPYPDARSVGTRIR